MTFSVSLIHSVVLCISFNFILFRLLTFDLTQQHKKKKPKREQKKKKRHFILCNSLDKCFFHIFFLWIRTKRVHLKTSSIICVCVCFCVVFYCWILLKLVHRLSKRKFGNLTESVTFTSTIYARIPSQIDREHHATVVRVLCCILLHSFSFTFLIVNCCI